jgi:chorismate dehydratase
LSESIYHITAVSYLNTKPFLFGLFNSPIIDFVDIDLSHPAECARKLKEGKADIGLIPVASLQDLDEYYLIGDYCIGADGEVKTVCLFSEVPIQQIEKIYLDYESRTSVELVQILMKFHWKHEVIFESAKPGFISDIKGTSAGLVIGDRAIALLDQYEYVYDLAAEWKIYTGGLPFVFAVWVSRKPLDPLLLKIFNAALASGVKRIGDLVKILPTPIENFDLIKYFREDISYDFDDRKKEALQLFLQKVKELKL